MNARFFRSDTRAVYPEEKIYRINIRTVPKSIMPCSTAKYGKSEGRNQSDTPISAAKGRKTRALYKMKPASGMNGRVQC